MATIKDIAQLAGVSQGTVSNVLNGKGNVSSEKIVKVEQAAAALGFTINERAKLLRKGKADILAVILPTIRFRHYVDFYLSFKAFAENHGYDVIQYVSEDNPEKELKIVAQARSAMVAGIAVFSCLQDPLPAYLEAGYEESEILLVERGRGGEANYLGFDYTKCGKDLAEQAMKTDLERVTVVTGSLEFSNEAEFFSAFQKTFANRREGSMSHFQTDQFRCNQSAIQLFSAFPPEAIFISNYGFAEIINDVWRNFFASVETVLYTVSPIFTMPESDFSKYELNYRLMGKVSAEFLIANVLTRKCGQRRILENAGFRNWYGRRSKHPALSSHRLNVITLDSPAAAAMKNLSRIYTQTTGVDVNISVFSYDEIYEIFNTMEESSIYDVVRLDVTWLSWFAHKILLPLEKIEPKIASVLDTFVEGLSRQYSYVEDSLYAIPISPSNQVLFYRKDLFDSTVMKRLYQEMNKSQLAPPSTFAEYNRIARFFTRAFNDRSPVEFGTTVTLGSTGVAATEFLTRYFSGADRLFTPEGRILLTTKNAIRALEFLVEARQYAKERYCSWWTNAAKEFAGGDVAMTILYTNFASEILGTGSKIVNKIGFARVPGKNSIIGGGTLGISKFSKDPGLALSYVKWLCSEPISSALALLGSVPVARKSFENYELVGTYPWLELSKECFATSRYHRTPSTDYAPFDERRFLSFLGVEVKNAYSGVLTPREALERAQHQYEANAASLLGL